MKAIPSWLLIGSLTLAAACGGGDAEDTPRSAAPDVSGETTPPPVPLPPETEPQPAGGALPADTAPDGVTP